jgi:molybdenum cofactor sulfurtransferase
MRTSIMVEPPFVFSMVSMLQYDLTAVKQLPAKSLIDSFADDIKSNLYGNPHSNSTPAHLSGERIDNIRIRALRFFNADPEDFDLIFVANASAAIKLVVDCFRDTACENKRSSQRKFWYGYHRDSHNSVVGGRELTSGNHRCFHSDAQVDDWIDDPKSAPDHNQLGLFAYPGQSNQTGRRLPLSYPKRIRASRRGQNTYTLLDAAALATTTQLNLDEVQPDFVSISFYKIFGFPNLGALIVRKASGHTLLQRRYFGGGTVDMVIVLEDSWRAMREEDVLHNRLEDGTLPFYSIFALDHAMTIHNQLFTSMARISVHTCFLIKHLYSSMSTLNHSNGTPLFQIYSEKESEFGDPETQGSTIAFNFFRPNGEAVGYRDVEKHANEYGIFIRSGGLCNPGGTATYLNWSTPELRKAFAAGLRCSQPFQIVNGKLTGVVRISLGAMSTKEDVDRFLRYAQDHYVDIETEKVHGVVYIEKKLPASSSFFSDKKPKVTLVATNSIGWSRRAKARLAKIRRGYCTADVASV